MKQLICGTTAYRTFSNDAAGGRLSHAYMLHFNDVKNLRDALKIFALRFFGLTEENGRRILNESFSDCRIFPEEGKKLTADAVAALLADSILKPLECDRKLYIISGFEQATPLLQNKLLKTLEEPPQGVHFLLGVTSPAPVLDTVKSRVKTLVVPPFTEEQIYAALRRKDATNPLNRAAAESCGGIFGAAENMVKGGWFAEIAEAAREICAVRDAAAASRAAVKYGDTKYKNELLAQMGLNYRNALCGIARGGGSDITAAALTYAAEAVDKAVSDVKFNAFFQGLLFDLMLRIIEENDRWLKLQA